MVKLKDFFDCPEELIIDGIASSIFFYWLIGWAVLPLICVNGVLWRLGGVKGGNKLWRRLGVPFVVCIISAISLHKPFLMLAIPFMVWLAPSYGEESWLFKKLNNDFLVRIICFWWYWLAFSLAYMLK